MENKGIVQSNPAGNTQGHIKRSRSTFGNSLSYRLYYTPRFGYYTPTFLMDGIPTDEIHLHSTDYVDSLSLQAPFKGSISKEKRSFMIPKMALLPFNWDQIYTLPSAGDDVPDDANTCIANFYDSAARYWLAAAGQIASGSLPTGGNITIGSNGVFPSALVGYYTAALRVLTLGEYQYSSGSLLNILGCKLSANFFANTTYNVGDPGTPLSSARSVSYDQMYDEIIAAMFSNLSYLSVSVGDSVNGKSNIRTYLIRGPRFTETSAGLSSAANLLRKSAPFRTLLDIFRENPLAWISAAYMNMDDFDQSAYVTRLNAAIRGYFGSTPGTNPGTFTILSPAQSGNPGSDLDPSDPTSLSPTVLNFGPLAAYQMCCAHFMTNSNLDFIYSADLYRQYFYGLWKALIDVYPGAASEAYFTWNGISKPYDYLSGRIVSRLLFVTPDSGAVSTFAYSALSSSALELASDSALPIRFAAWSMLFGYRRSLRYGDYFTLARPTPLAVGGNTSIPVTANTVDVIDVTRNIQFQRLRNASMRWRNKIEEYTQGLFGSRPAPDYHNPFILHTERSTIFGDDIQNTASEQANEANSRTANFAARPSEYMFTFRNDDAHPCYYMQIVSFDVRRAYTATILRNFFHANRFDMFNPALQYIGDQPLYLAELGYNPDLTTASGAFGYKTRDAEFKESYDQASGGFIEFLPGWSFTDLASRGANSGTGLTSINDDFIRSWPAELDQFYLALTGYSLASSFHFVMITDNDINASRPISIDPQILA